MYLLYQLIDLPALLVYTLPQEKLHEEVFVVACRDGYSHPPSQVVLNKHPLSCYNAGTNQDVFLREYALRWYTARAVYHRNSAEMGAIVERVLLDSAQLARAAVDVASDKKAFDILLLDIRDLTTVADYFVICSGNNARQLQAIADALDEELEKQGARLLHREGAAETGWVLLDFGDVIVHIFGTKEREYYRLERLWSDAKTVVYLQ